MPDLESEESAEQRRNQEKQGLKILTPNRLTISLANYKYEIIQKKLKNDIRLLLYSLYPSNKLTETIYEYLINTI